MINTEMEPFDEKLELFLRKKMTESEEKDFISELKNDSEKMNRAKVMALAIKEMNNIKRETDKTVLESISKIDKKTFLDSIWASPKMEAFDERVDKFLRKELSTDEEKQLLFELEETPYLKNRARTIALAAKKLKVQSDANDQEVIKAIKDSENIILAQTTEKSTKNGRIFKMFSKAMPYFAAACVGAFCFWGGNKFFSTNDSMPDNSNVIRSSDHDSTDPIDLFKEITDLETDMSWMIAQLDSCYTIAKQNDSYLGDLQWNLAIAHMLNGNKQKAIDYLNEIVNENEEGDAIVDKAKKLLKTLD